MELRKSWDLRKIVVVGYFVLFLIYILIGLTPAEATNYKPDTEIEIPAIGLSSDVISLKMDGPRLQTPDDVVGSFSRSKNKTFLVGHASGIFSNLVDVKIGDEITYDLLTYIVKKVEIVEKSQINMDLLLLPEDVDTIVIMTCAGEELGGGDATHRLIITAEVE